MYINRERKRVGTEKDGERERGRRKERKRERDRQRISTTLRKEMN